MTELKDVLVFDLAGNNKGYTSKTFAPDAVIEFNRNAGYVFTKGMISSPEDIKADYFNLKVEGGKVTVDIRFLKPYNEIPGIQLDFSVIGKIIAKNEEGHVTQLRIDALNMDYTRKPTETT